MLVIAGINAKYPQSMFWADTTDYNTLFEITILYTHNIFLNTKYGPVSCILRIGVQWQLTWAGLATISWFWQPKVKPPSKRV